MIPLVCRACKMLETQLRERDNYAVIEQTCLSWVGYLLRTAWKVLADYAT